MWFYLECHLFLKTNNAPLKYACFCVPYIPLQQAFLAVPAVQLYCFVLFAGFSSDQCPEGFVAVSKSTLRIITVENVGETFNQSVTKLMYTPRKFVIHDSYKLLYVVESDHQSASQLESKQAKMTENGGENGQVGVIEEEKVHEEA